MAALNSAIAAADLSLRGYTDGKVADAVAGLATIASVNSAIAAADLSLRGYTDGKVADAVAGLASVAALNSAIAAADLSLRGYTDTKTTEAVAGLATVAALNGVSTTASLALAAGVDAQGKVNAVAGFEVKSNGKIGGMRFANNGVVTKAVFDVDSAEFTGDLIVAGTIKNDQLELNALTGFDVAYNAGTITLANNTPTRIHGRWIDVKRAASPIDIIISAWATFRHDPGGSFVATVQLVRSRTLTGGEIIQSFTINGSGMANDTWQGPVPVMFVDQPGETGLWHYYVQIFFNVANMTVQSVSTRYARLTELKNNTVAIDTGTGTGAGVGSGGGTGGGGDPILIEP